MSQARLGELVGSSQARISNLETGKACADVDEAADIEAATRGLVKATIWSSERKARREARRRRWAEAAHARATLKGAA